MAANSVNEIYFMNAYNDKLINQQLYLICPCGERDDELKYLSTTNCSASTLQTSLEVPDRLRNGTRF